MIRNPQKKEKMKYVQIMLLTHGKIMLLTHGKIMLPTHGKIGFLHMVRLTSTRTEKPNVMFHAHRVLRLVFN